MNTEITRETLEWFMGEPEAGRPLMRDGIWAVMGWRDLQSRPVEKEPNILLWMAVAVMVSFILPVLAWSAPQIQSVEVPVLEHSLPRGSIITAGDLTTQTLPAPVSGNILQHEADIIGKEVFRGVRAGAPIFESHIRVPPTVRKNGVVAVHFKADGLMINGTGKALEDAMVGHSVRVMNPDSGHVMAGVVLPNGSVEIQ